MKKEAKNFKKNLELEIEKCFFVDSPAPELKGYINCIANQLQACIAALENNKLSVKQHRLKIEKFIQFLISYSINLNCILWLTLTNKYWLLLSSLLESFLVLENPHDKFAFTHSLTAARLYEENLVHWAVRMHNLPFIVYLRQTNPELFSTWNIMGETPLRLAIKLGYHDLVNYLEHSPSPARSTNMATSQSICRRPKHVLQVLETNCNQLIPITTPQNTDQEQTSELKQKSIEDSTVSLPSKIDKKKPKKSQHIVLKIGQIPSAVITTPQNSMMTTHANASIQRQNSSVHVEASLLLNRLLLAESPITLIPKKSSLLKPTHTSLVQTVEDIFKHTEKSNTNTLLHLAELLAIHGQGGALLNPAISKFLFAELVHRKRSKQYQDTDALETFAKNLSQFAINNISNIHQIFFLSARAFHAGIGIEKLLQILNDKIAQINSPPLKRIYMRTIKEMGVILHQANTDENEQTKTSHGLLAVWQTVQQNLNIMAQKTSSEEDEDAELLKPIYIILQDEFNEFKNSTAKIDFLQVAQQVNQNMTNQNIEQQIIKIATVLKLLELDKGEEAEEAKKMAATLFAKLTSILYAKVGSLLPEDISCMHMCISIIKDLGVEYEQQLAAELITKQLQFGGISYDNFISYFFKEDREKIELLLQEFYRHGAFSAWGTLKEKYAECISTTPVKINTPSIFIQNTPETPSIAPDLGNKNVAMTIFHTDFVSKLQPALNKYKRDSLLEEEGGVIAFVAELHNGKIKLESPAPSQKVILAYLYQHNLVSADKLQTFILDNNDNLDLTKPLTDEEDAQASNFFSNFLLDNHLLNDPLGFIKRQMENVIIVITNYLQSQLQTLKTSGSIVQTLKNSNFENAHKEITFYTTLLQRTTKLHKPEPNRYSFPYSNPDRDMKATMSQEEWPIYFKELIDLNQKIKITKGSYLFGLLTLAYHAMAINYNPSYRVNPQESGEYILEFLTVQQNNALIPS